jgi:predicted nucleic acid-binding protein
MKAFLDTSVLVPAALGDHELHNACLDLLVRHAEGEACCAAHSLAEVYAVLTKLPGKHRITPDQALLYIGSLRERLTVVSLTGGEYAESLTQAATLGIQGGTVYDLLLSACALKAEAKAIYTSNLRHYALCGPEVQRRLKTP